MNLNFCIYRRKQLLAQEDKKKTGSAQIGTSASNTSVSGGLELRISEHISETAGRAGLTYTPPTASSSKHQVGCV